MTRAEETPIESLEAWLAGKPYWEQYVWKLNLEKDALSDADLDKCYEYLSDHLRLDKIASRARAAIVFRSEISTPQEIADRLEPIRLVELKDLKGVNAISAGCTITFGSHLTLIYGPNGSGKSGVGRLLCNACFSRGEREILPNVKNGAAQDTGATATFVVEDGPGKIREIHFNADDEIEDLKRFSVFDSQSVLIHLDGSNKVNFTPGNIKVFDKVADTISALEQKLTNEKNLKKVADPFQAMFLDSTSDVALFCKSIDSNTTTDDLLRYANFVPDVDDRRLGALQKQIEEKRKLDIPKKKSQLAADRQNLQALKASLLRIVDRLTVAKAKGVNNLIEEIAEKKKLTAALSAESFDDGILKSVGTEEWRSLISAAKVLHDKEIALEGGEPTHCMLCHQKLTKSGSSLFIKYWEFLESKAESELSQLNEKLHIVLDDLRLAKTLFPKFLATDAGVRVLNEDDESYLAELKASFMALRKLLDEWVSRLENTTPVEPEQISEINFKKLDLLISTKEAEESNLTDPTAEIAELTAALNSLQHRKVATAVKDAALEYLGFLKWSAKASAVSFSGLKMAITKKRTESFLAGIAMDYKGVFNQELAQLGCDFNLVMFTSGEQGNTVKEYRLDFAEDYTPSQILSEGEQNACSLADFLTEAQLDKHNCGIIFDDPVTSLDHERKDRIAKRLVLEAARRQVVIFTHDLVFMSQLAKYADRNSVPVDAHWMKTVDGIPGFVEKNTSPKLATVASLKMDSQNAVRGYTSLGAKEQEIALGAALDYLRSACEALIEETLFAGAIQRYEDHIRVQNLEEAIFDQPTALRIVDLHGRLSEVILAHNRSDLQRENPLTMADLTGFRKEFEDLEAKLKELKKTARNERTARKDTKADARAGW